MNLMKGKERKRKKEKKGRKRGRRVKVSGWCRVEEEEDIFILSHVVFI